MEREITIKYHFTRNEGDGEVLKAHEPKLEEAAMAHIGYMLKQGYYCGELCETILDEEDPILGDEVEYRGWWTTGKE